MLEKKAIGNITIAVQDDEFFDGYQVGYLHFRTCCQGATLSEGDLQLFLTRNYFDGNSTERYNIGYITGWYAALFSNEPQRDMQLYHAYPLNERGLSMKKYITTYIIARAHAAVHDTLNSLYSVT